MNIREFCGLKKYFKPNKMVAVTVRTQKGMSETKLRHYRFIYLATIFCVVFASSGLRADERTPASKALSERTKEFLSDPARTGSLLGSILVGAAVPNPLSPLLGSLAGFFIGKSSAYSEQDNISAQRQASAKRSLIPDEGAQVARLSGLTGNQPQASEQINLLASTGDELIEGQSGLIEQIAVVGGAPIVSVVEPLAEDKDVSGVSDQPEPLADREGAPIDSAIRSLSAEMLAGDRSQPTEPALAAGNPASEFAIQSLSEEVLAARQSARARQTQAGGRARGHTAIDSAIRSMTGKTGARSRLQQQLASACSNVQLGQPLSLGCYYHSQ